VQLTAAGELKAPVGQLAGRGALSTKVLVLAHEEVLKPADAKIWRGRSKKCHCMPALPFATQK